VSFDTTAAREGERREIVAFGRAYLKRHEDSAFSLAHLKLFLDAVEGGSHVGAEARALVAKDGKVSP
jgi:hypothetical protein